MRIDLFLKLAGIIKTRSRAKRACDGGYVTINGSPAKPASDVSAGDLLEVEGSRGSRRVLRVDRIPETRQVSRRRRRELYTELDGD